MPDPVRIIDLAPRTSFTATVELTHAEIFDGEVYAETWKALTAAIARQAFQSNAVLTPGAYRRRVKGDGDNTGCATLELTWQGVLQS